MRYQNAYSENTVLLVIALVAMVVLILMLFAVLVIVRSEGKTKNEAGPEKEHQASLTSAEHDRPPAQEKPNGERDARPRGIFESLKRFNWAACYAIASFVAYSGYDRLQHFMLPLFQIPGYYYWSAYIFAILSPACIAVAWLRLTGAPWRQALQLFLFVPVGAFVIWYMFNILPYMLAN